MKKTLLTIAIGALAALTFSSCGNKSTAAGDGACDTVDVGETFDFTPIQPVDATRKAVIVLGASGFDCFAIEVDGDRNWKKVFSEFGNSMVTAGLANAATTQAKLRDYIKMVIDSTGVKGSDIHFVVSSGAMDKERDAVEAIIASLKEIGYQVNVVTAEQESRYAYLTAMPNGGFDKEAFVVDMGTGNTKVAWLEDGEIKTLETYGSGYFKKGTDDYTVYADVKEKLTGVPSANCKRLFIIGGVPYSMAKVMKRGKERFTVLSTRVSDYDELAADKGDKVKAGVNIFKGIVEAMGVQQVIFDWDANFGIGFLLDME